MSNEKITANWFRTRYRMTPDNWLVPVSKAPLEDYDPFNMYNSENEESGNLYLIFANLDVNEIGEIESFYNRFGSLGLMYRELGGISPQAGDPNENMGMETEREESTVFDEDRLGYLWGEDRIPISLYHAAGLYKFDAEDLYRHFYRTGIVPDNIEIQKLAGESNEEFKIEHAKFVTLINLYINIKDGKLQSIKDSLTSFIFTCENIPTPKSDNNTENSDMDKKAIKSWWEDEDNPESIITGALEELTGYLNKEIAEGANLKMVFDPVSFAISKEIQWKCESLLGALYIMFINDIANGMKIRRCINCGKYYRGGRPEMKYCGTSCQNRAKTKRYQEQIKAVQNMYSHGKSVEEIARELKKDVKQIKKWTEMTRE